MEFAEIKSILAGKANGEVSIHGWVHNKRSSGGIIFIILRDGTGMVQCTIRKEKIDAETFKEIDKLPVESVVEIKGNAKEDKRAPGGYEVLVDGIKVTSRAVDDYPVTKKFHGPEFLMENRHLWLRSDKMQAILRARAKVLEAVRDWFRQNGFTEFQSPIFTTMACEGGSTLFHVKYFDQEAYLSQSWQLQAEAAIYSLGKIYTVAPSFRAEQSRTRRHLAEYWHIEAEAPWCELDCIMNIEDHLISAVCKKLAEEMPNELKAFGRDPAYLLTIKPPFERITYDKAIEILQKSGVKIKWGDDIDWRHEKILTLKFDKPFHVIKFPKKIKAFYHKPDPERPDVTLSNDMLAPEGYGEIIGSGQRIDDAKQLLARLKEEGIDPKPYQWYIDLRKYGSVPHSGFGLGLERAVMWLFKLEHIRDAIPFPRFMNHIYP